MYDPVRLAEEIMPRVSEGDKRRYYRLVRGGRWYGGISTADCVGCNLRCIFCWSNYPRDHPSRAGRYYTPEEVSRALLSNAKRHRYRQVRISGNEPTLIKEHLFTIIELINKADLKFILETNGILIDGVYVKRLASYRNLSVRVSLKGASPEEFSRLTGADREAFSLQIRALELLYREGVDCWASVMLSFSNKTNVADLRKRIRGISPRIHIEEEYIFLYPHVVKRLRKAGLKPNIAYPVDEIPDELV